MSLYNFKGGWSIFLLREKVIAQDLIVEKRKPQVVAHAEA